jgi:hypothetical protein
MKDALYYYPAVDYGNVQRSTSRITSQVARKK